MTTKGQIVVYGTTWCPDCTRSKRLLDRRQTPYSWVNIEEDPQAVALVVQLNRGMRIVPTIVFPDGTVLAEPSDRVLAGKLESLGR
ncbi:MAG: NrdH-redoxin [Chloroflexi bacterium]|nr:NrdH-redoxin [Chloroflexota bacterium]